MTQYAVYAVLIVCCTRCMLYSVYAVLGVCCTRCSVLIMAWRDREQWLNFVFLGDGRIEDEKERDQRRLGEIIMRYWDFGEFHTGVNGPSPIQQVRDPIQHIITLIQALPNPIRQVVPLISHIRLYPPHLSLSCPQLYYHCITLS